MSERVCTKCGERISYSAPDTHFLAVERKGAWPEWSDARCIDGGFHEPKPTEMEFAEAEISKAADMIERQAIRISELERDVEEWDALRERMTNLLTRTANVLKGSPGPLQKHDWSDLPEVARRLLAVDLLTEIEKRLQTGADDYLHIYRSDAGGFYAERDGEFANAATLRNALMALYPPPQS